jgi:hypothetical protein
MAAALALVVAVLLGATAYEVAVALEWISLGPAPGDGPAGGGVVLSIALVAMVVGAVLVVWPKRSSAWSTLLAPAAAAFMTARFYTFDPYYLPTLRRMSDAGLVAGRWIIALDAAAVLAAVLMLVRPRFARLPTALVLILCACTAVVESSGH